MILPQAHRPLHSSLNTDTLHLRAFVHLEFSSLRCLHAHPLLLQACAQMLPYQGGAPTLTILLNLVACPPLPHPKALHSALLFSHSTYLLTHFFYYIVYSLSVTIAVCPLT